MQSCTYVLYARRSQDAQDRQIQSIDDQIAIMKEIAQKKKLHIQEVITESHSAKTPGDRKGFQKMIKLIVKGKVQGILTWHLDRLARNPIDGGQITWLLENGSLESIITPSQEYQPKDNILPMHIEFGMANQYIQNLSRDIKRGYLQKAKRGWYPHRPPLGYKSNMHERLPGDNKEIITDPKTGPIIQSLFRSLGQNTTTVADIVRKAEDLGLTNRLGKPYAKSQLYRIFRNKFYTGVFDYEGEEYQGKHEPLVSQEVFEKVQKQISKRSKNKGFKVGPALLTHLVHCSSCDRYLGAERHRHTNCSKCKRRFSGRRKDTCPQCHTKATSFNEYTYYKCSNKTCHDYVREEDLFLEVSQKIHSLLADPSHTAYFNAVPYLENRSRFEKELKGEIRIHKRQLTQEKGKEKELFNLLLEKTITKETYGEELKVVQDKIASIEKKIRQEESKVASLQDKQVDTRTRAQVMIDALESKEMECVRKMLDEIGVQLTFLNA